MKRLLVACMSVILLLALAACGDDSPEPYQKEILEDDNVSNDVTIEDEEEEKVSDTDFDNGEYVYKIKSIEQIKGEVEEGKDPDLLVVIIEFTNNTDNLIEPTLAEGLSAYQETDDTIDFLDVVDPEISVYPQHYKSDLIKRSKANIKPGKTVETVISFEINAPGKDVILKDSGDFESKYDGELFERTVETKDMQ